MNSMYECEGTVHVCGYCLRLVCVESDVNMCKDVIGSTVYIPQDDVCVLARSVGKTFLYTLIQT